MENNKYNLCACMGPMYGEPYCACQMKQKGLEAEMDNNPLRIAERERSKKQWADFEAKGGWKQLRRDGKRQ